MAVNLEGAPYYDDYLEDKQFYRILFKPGVSVQARELTQMQTIIQKQIERHGRHIFKDGAAVLDGTFSYVNNFNAVKLNPANGSFIVNEYLDQLVGKTIVGRETGIVARVITYEERTETDPPTIYVSYVNASKDRVTSTFADNEELYSTSETTINGIAKGFTVAVTATNNAKAVASSAAITKGVYFVKGHFVLVDEQRIVISKYDNKPNARIGLKVVESIVTASEDDSLLDNASGTPNNSAIGADRYSLDLVLTHIPLDSTDDADFIELSRVVNGVQQAKAKPTEYSVLEENLARRTFDESGDYIVKPFSYKIRESLDDGINGGVYEVDQTTEDGNTPSNDLMTLQISPGKAYVRGYEIETVVPRFIDIEKPRDTKRVDGAISTMEVGNYIRVNKVVGMPDTVGASSEIQDYPVVNLYDQPGATGEIIGQARVRGFEFDSGNQASDNDVFGENDQFKLFLFDVKIGTKLVMNDSLVASQLTVGSYITGVTSRSSGYVREIDTDNNVIWVNSATGKFITGTNGENITSNNSAETNNLVTNSGSTALKISSAVYNTFEYVKSFSLSDAEDVASGGLGAGATTFQADSVLERSTQISGFVSTTAASATINGFNTLFEQDLRVGDAISIPSGAGGVNQIFYISQINSNTSLTIDAATSTTTENPDGLPDVSVSSVAAYRRRSVLNDQDKNILVRKLATDYISTLKPDGINVNTIAATVREEFVESANEGKISISAAGRFSAESNYNYQVVVLNPGVGASASAGDYVNMENAGVSITGADTGSSKIEINVPVSIIGSGSSVPVKVIATYTKTNAAPKSKSAAINKLLVRNISGVADYGTSTNHRDWSLGTADVYKLLAVYDSGTVGTAPTIPNIVYNNLSGSQFQQGELLVGEDSGAVAMYIENVNSTLRVVPQSNTRFVAGELVTAQSSGITFNVTSYEKGSTNITGQFLLDTGQRDNIYDIAKLVKKNVSFKPTGDVVVLFKSFSHGTGDFFTVDSYFGSVDYSEIPQYNSTRVDTETRDPDGNYDLESCVDFRPRVADAITAVDGTSGFKYVNAPSLDFNNRNFSGLGSSVSLVPADNSNFLYDYEYYLRRNDSIFLTKKGKFVHVKGIPSEQPNRPLDIENAIRLIDIDMAPYASDVYNEVLVKKTRHKRYTMKDISRLEDRISTLEYYTSLTLLEKDAASLQVKDANGLDRFKSGFVVDNFAGHATGDVLARDYRCAMDMSSRVLRPKYSMRNIALTENDLEGSNYKVTGNIATLDYENVVSIEQVYASRIENLNPVLNFSWAGRVKLEPSSDEWFEINRLPDITINQEGNFNTVLAQNANALGTIWDAPTLQWSGNTTTSSTEWRETQFGNGPNGARAPRRILRTTTTTETGTATRTGVSTQVVQQIDIESQGDALLSSELIPYMRSRDIYFEANGLKPFTRVYPFFDKVNVSNYVQRATGAYEPIDPNAVKVATVGDKKWTKISKVEIFYDGNRIVNTIYLQWKQNPDDDWRLIGRVASENSGGVASPNGYNVAAFNLGTDSYVEPNENGLVYFRVLVNRRNMNIPASDGSYGGAYTEYLSVQLSEIRSYAVLENPAEAEEGTDPNYYLLDNPTRAEVTSTFNISKKSWEWIVPWYDSFIRGYPGVSKLADQSGSAKNLFDGVVNYDSNRSNLSEAYASNSRHDIVVEWKMRGGVSSSGAAEELFISPDNISLDDGALVTDGAGRVAGVFTIPDSTIAGNPAFLTGERLFRLSSSPTNADEGVETFAQAPYTAKGILETRQETFTATRNGVVTTRDVSETVNVSRVVDRTTTQIGWWDPLAQSIMPSTEGGEFVTKVEVFFHSKDPSLPVTCELREMVNGYPTTKVLPMASKTLTPDEVYTDPLKGEVGTSFVFDSPIYLPQNVEVAIVLWTDSDKYLTWISRMGDKDTNGRTISEQPYLGVLFKSQNNSTWTAYDYEDLKFRVYRAKFDISQPATIVLENDSDKMVEQIRNFNPISLTAGSTVVKVNHSDHGMYSGSDYVTLSGLSSNVVQQMITEIDSVSSGVSFFVGDATTVTSPWNGMPDPTDTVTEHYFKIYNLAQFEEQPEIIKGTVSLDTEPTSGQTRYKITATQRGLFGTLALTFPLIDVNGDGSLYAGSPVELYEYNGIPLSDINATHKIIDHGLDYYTIDISDVDSYSGAVPSITENIGGEREVRATFNAMADAYQLMIPIINYPETSVRTELQMVTATSPSGNQAPYISTGYFETTVGDRVEFADPHMIASTTNEAKSAGGNKTFRTRITLQSTVDNLSPVVDLERKSITTYSNRLDNIKSANDVFPAESFVEATEPEGDSGESIYITKRVQLETPATSIKVLLDIIRDASAEVQVMYKILRSDDSTDFDEIGWTYFNGTGGPDKNVLPVSDLLTYKEYEFTEDELPEFISFAVKIKMNGTNSARPPQLKNLRAIALAV